jgi:hypothetical protein
MSLQRWLKLRTFELPEALRQRSWPEDQPGAANTWEVLEEGGNQSRATRVFLQAPYMFLQYPVEEVKY